MKQRSSNYDDMYHTVMNDDDDHHHHHNRMEVASILLQLPNLIASRNNRLRPLSWPAWGTKRKRSAEDTSFLRRLLFPSPQSSIPEITAIAAVPVLPPEKCAVKVEASNSPATPLSFSPSESEDEKQPKRLKRKLSVKKRKEELLEIKNECTITNEFLRKEVEQTRHYLMRLEAQNPSLKARKQELKGGGVMNKEKASGILPDLNVSYPVWMDYFQPLDQGNKSYNKVMAAQARQRRMLICRDKNFGAITKLRFSRK